ncbi:hypothetical protein LY76DRAFT_135915 [Colletotrichum caudatum]|nr:hypothetical protein LY76DRAFT_135915 [Colletotrichum caudatum]
MSAWKRAVSSITLHNSYALPAVGFPMGQLIMIRLADADRGSRRAGRVPASLDRDPMDSRIPDDCPIANLPPFMRPRNHARDFHPTGASRSGPICPPRAQGTVVQSVFDRYRLYTTRCPRAKHPQLDVLYLAYRLQHRHAVHGISRTACFLQLGQLDQMTLPKCSQPPKDERRRRKYKVPRNMYEVYHVLTPREQGFAEPASQSLGTS